MFQILNLRKFNQTYLNSTFMDRQELVSIMAKYMDGVATEPEAFATLDHLLQSRENRQIFNIASAGFNRMQPIIQQRI